MVQFLFYHVLLGAPYTLAPNTHTQMNECVSEDKFEDKKLQIFQNWL